MTNIKEQARTLAEVLAKTYEDHKYDPQYSLWGVAYCWDPTSSTFVEAQVTNPLAAVIPHIFLQARSEGLTIKKPSIYIPKAQNQIGHYNFLCLGNRPLVQTIFLSLLDGKCSGIEDLLDDSRLLQESLQTYITRYQEHQLPATVDLIDFLLHHTTGHWEESKQPAGRYRHLLERLYLQFEDEDLLTACSSFVPQQLYVTMLACHTAALRAKSVTLDAALVEAYAPYSKEDTDQQPAPLCSPRGESLKSLLGARRVRKGWSGGASLDWEAFEERHAARRKAAMLLNPNKVLAARLENRFIAQYVEAYRTSGAEAIHDLQQRIATTTNPQEQEALYTTLRVLQSIHRFDISSRINHTMVIRKRTSKS